MATDSSSQQPPATDGGQDPAADQAAQFWAEHKTRTVAILDEWFEAKVKKYQGTGTSRTGGRMSLPGLIADLMFGPEKK